jgi:putative heme-binding domain-containing protein
MTRVLAMLFAIALPLWGADPSLPDCPPDWKIEVVLSAPEIRHPSVVCTSPDGRAFVAEDPMDISAPADRALGRILAIHPDGRVTVFAERLFAVFGMKYLEGSLYVLHNPKYTRFRDGGDRGEDRVDLIETTNPEPWAHDWNDHVPSNFQLAMDGYFYVSVGDKGLWGAVGQDGSKVAMRGGGILRMRPNATDLEIWCRGTRNTLDVAIDSEDELFTYDNTDEHDWMGRFTHMLENGFYGYPWDFRPRRPYTLWPLADFGAGAATGVFAYEDDLLPEPWRGSIFLADFGKKSIARVRVEREGATFRLASREDFIIARGTDASFRPVGIAPSQTEPVIWICDWQHPDTKADVVTGRLLRARFVGKHTPRARPDGWLQAALGRGTDASGAELVEALSHPSRDVRLAAQRALARRGEASRTRLVELVTKTTLAAENASPVETLAASHALWALDAIGVSSTDRAAIRAAADVGPPSLRRQALRAIGTRRDVTAIGVLMPSLRDPDASIRCHAATALGRMGSLLAIDPLIEALDETDLFARHATFQALHRIGETAPSAWPMVARGLASERSAVRDGTLHALRAAYDPAVVAALAEYVQSERHDESTRAGATSLLAELHLADPPWNGKWWDAPYHPALSPRPPRTNVWEGTASAIAALRDTLDDRSLIVRRAGLEAIAACRDLPSAAALVARVSNEPNVALRGRVLRVLATLDRDAALPAISSVADEAGATLELLQDVNAAALDAGGPEGASIIVRVLDRAASQPALRREAIDALGALAVFEHAPVVTAYLGDDDESVRAAAAEALAKLSGANAVAVLAPLTSDGAERVRLAAVRALGGLANPEAIPALVAAFEREELRTEAMLGLTETPDPRALDAYLYGLESRQPAHRARAAAAIRTVQDSVQPSIEARLAASKLEVRVVAELRRIYASPTPLDRWQILGPLPVNAPLPFAIETASGSIPDEEFRRERVGHAGKTARWHAEQLEREGRIRFEGLVEPETEAAVVACSRISAPEGRDVEFLVGSDGPIDIWLRGEKILGFEGSRSWAIDNDRIRARLEEGENWVIVRLPTARATQGFSVHLSGRSTGPLFEVDLPEHSRDDFLAFAMAQPGNAERGKALFVDSAGVACVRCHRVGELGENIGPDLSGIGSQYTRRELAEHVLYPSLKVREGYGQVTAVTKDGQVIAGILTADSDGDVTLRDADGRMQSLRRANLAELTKSDVSLMPEALEAGLSLHEFADVIAYLESLKAPSG